MTFGLALLIGLSTFCCCLSFVSSYCVFVFYKVSSDSFFLFVFKSRFLSYFCFFVFFTSSGCLICSWQQLRDFFFCSTWVLLHFHSGDSKGFFSIHEIRTDNIQKLVIRSSYQWSVLLIMILKSVIWLLHLFYWRIIFKYQDYIVFNLFHSYFYLVFFLVCFVLFCLFVCMFVCLLRGAIALFLQ